MGILGKIPSCIYISLGCVTLLLAALGVEMTEQQRARPNTHAALQRLPEIVERLQRIGEP